MKIKLENENTIETRESENVPTRSRRARLYNLLNTQYEREITGDEKKVIESFMVKDPPDFKKEYNVNGGVIFKCSGKVSFFLTNTSRLKRADGILLVSRTTLKPLSFIPFDKNYYLWLVYFLILPYYLLLHKENQENTYRILCYKHKNRKRCNGSFILE